MRWHRCCGHRPPDHCNQESRDFGNELAALGHFEKSDLEINENEKYKALRKLELFGDFTDLELWEVLRVAEWQKQPAKTVLFREDEMGDAFYILIEGGVSVTRRNRLLGTLGSGDCFGEMSYTNRKHMPRSASITSNTEITLMKIQPQQFDQLSDRCQLHFIQAFMYTLADRLRIATSASSAWRDTNSANTVPLKIPPATQSKFAKLGIRTPFDLVLHLPLRYEDETKITRIADLVPSESAQGGRR